MLLAGLPVSVSHSVETCEQRQLYDFTISVTRISTEKLVNSRPDVAVA